MTAPTPLSDRLSALSREDRARLFERLHGRRERGQRIAPRAPSALPPPLSFAQQRLWFLDQLNPGDVAYNIFFPVFLGGRLVPSALAAALAGVVARHEALRTTFALAGAEPVQRIAPRLDLPLPLVDLSRLGLSDPRLMAGGAPELTRLAAAEERRPFDLARGPLLRATLVHLAEEIHVLLLTLHHIVSDGWSTGVLVREMSALYRAALAGQRQSPLPPLALQYADFAIWQRTHLTGPVLATQVDFWRQYLAGAPAALPLPIDRPRPRIKTTAGRLLRLDLAPLHAPLKELSLRLGVTPFIVLMAAFQTFLGRYAGVDDLTVGTPIANRQKREIEGLIGFFVNTVVMRGRLAGNPSFAARLEGVRQDALAVFSHQDLPFEKLVEELQPERDPSRSPLFQALLVVQNTPVGKSEEGLEIDEVPLVRRSTKFDLTVAFDETEADGWRGSLAYNCDLFDESTAERLARHLLSLLGGALAEPATRLADLPLLAPGEIEALRARGEGPRLAAAPALLARIAVQVERDPGAVAVRFEDGGAGAALTYGELWERVGQAAGRLEELGVGPETVVGLAVDRSLELIVGLLAILAAGGAYLPLDPNYPAERLAFMVADSGARWVLGEKDIREKDIKDCKDIRDGVADPLPGSLESLAYLIYTSGSTGVPKGVMVSRGALATLAAAVERFGVGPGDRVLLFASPSFDASLLDVALALGQGATLVLAPKSLLLPGLELAASLAEWGITHLHLPPSALAALPVAPLPALRSLILGGEPCPPALAAQWAAGRTIWNDYGPTEAAVFVTAGPIGPPGTGPIELGETVAGDDLLLLDAQGTPVPLGAPGEIGLGGSGLARGYRGRPELTALRFVPHPFCGRGAAAGARLYLTGDLARRAPRGGVEYLGRADRQIKVRGFRVEPGEVEAVLAAHAAVRQVAVVARQERDFRSVLTACVAWAGDEAEAADELRRHAEQRLPAYLVPRAFVFLPELPVLPSGKADRRALEKLAAAGARAAGPLLAPRSDLERQVAGIWEEALGVAVGVEDNFFDLGGHSLLLTRVQLELRDRLGRDVPLLALFEHTTVRSLALHLEGDPPAISAPVAVDARDRAARQREVALAQRQRLQGKRAAS